MYNNLLEDILHRMNSNRGVVFGSMIITALLAFELFNYTTTDYAFSDLLGTLEFLGIKWATILAIAFCGIDFAGIARLFTPERDQEAATEIWYLFGAWLLAATMNAVLTWWGVSLAILHHETLGNAIIDRATLLRVVPIFIAIMVWLIRVLILGSFSLAGDRLFSQPAEGQIPNPRYNHREVDTPPSPLPERSNRIPEGPAYQGFQGRSRESYRSRGEPTYHPRLVQTEGTVKERGRKNFP